MEENLEFDFERLEVYKLALDFLDFIFKICKDISKDLEYCLGDNLILNRQQAISREDYLKARNYGKRLTSMLFKLIAST